MQTARVFFAALALTGAAWAADPFVGTWKTNVEKSAKTSSGQPRAASTLTVKAISDGYAITSTSVTTPFILHLDGKDYKDDTKGFAATVGADHSSARRIDSNKIETTFKRNNKVVGTIQRELSPDGRTMTGTFRGTDPKAQKVDYTVIFEKQ